MFVRTKLNLFILLAVSVVLGAMSSSRTEVSDLSVQVCLREKLPSSDYPFAEISSTVGISMKAFGITLDSPIEIWRNRSIEELVEIFEEYVVKHNIPDAQRYMLDFEKIYSNTHIENRRGIERSIAAVRSVMPDAEILLYGTPFPVRRNGKLHPAYNDPEYIEWVQSLDVGFVPILYIRGDTSPSLQEIEAATKKVLSVFPPDRSTPYLWHKWNNAGNWKREF